MNKFDIEAIKAGATVLTVAGNSRLRYLGHAPERLTTPHIFIDIDGRLVALDDRGTNGFGHKPTAYMAPIKRQAWTPVYSHGGFGAQYETREEVVGYVTKYGQRGDVFIGRVEWEE
jgi:hypothetical protein